MPTTTTHGKGYATGFSQVKPPFSRRRAREGDLCRVFTNGAGGFFEMLWAGLRIDTHGLGPGPCRQPEE
jgi:hypothetical protein